MTIRRFNWRPHPAEPSTGVTTTGHRKVLAHQPCAALSVARLRAGAPIALSTAVVILGQVLQHPRSLGEAHFPSFAPSLSSLLPSPWAAQSATPSSPPKQNHSRRGTRTCHRIRMINFAGGFNLPIWVAEREGLFAAEKISVKIDFPPGSTYQLTHLIAGTYDMGFTAIDNIIAYREGQNEAYLPPGTNVDLIAVLASDDGFLSISARKDFTSVSAPC